MLCLGMNGGQHHYLSLLAWANSQSGDTPLLFPPHCWQGFLSVSFVPGATLDPRPTTVTSTPNWNKQKQERKKKNKTNPQWVRKIQTNNRTRQKQEETKSWLNSGRNRKKKSKSYQISWLNYKVPKGKQVQIKMWWKALKKERERSRRIKGRQSSVKSQMEGSWSEVEDRLRRPKI